MGNRKVKGNVTGTCEMCKQKGYIELHHIKPVILGGNDSKDNLINLCYDCHKIIHKLGIYSKQNIENIKTNGLEQHLYAEYCIENNKSNNFVKEFGLQQIEFAKYIMNMLRSENNNKSKLIKQGLEVARAKGKILGRPKAELPDDFIKQYEKFKNGDYGTMSAMSFAKILGIGRSTLYKYINIYNKKGLDVDYNFEELKEGDK